MSTALTMRKQFAAQLQTEKSKRQVLARISTNVVDRDGEVLISTGCVVDEFLQSPTVFFNHDYNLPLGRCVELKRSENKIEARTEFAQRPDGHQGAWLADVVLSLFEQQVIKGFSVGFLPVEGRKATSADRKLYGPEVRYIHSKWKLLEYSVAPLPCNQEALALAVGKGLCSPAEIKRLFGGMFDTETAFAEEALRSDSAVRRASRATSKESLVGGEISGGDFGGSSGGGSGGDSGGGSGGNSGGRRLVLISCIGGQHKSVAELVEDELLRRCGQLYRA